MTAGKASWNADDWNIDNGAGAGNGALDAPAGYDPKSWIGAVSVAATTSTGAPAATTATDVTIPETADLNNEAGARYVELYSVDGQSLERRRLGLWAKPLQTILLPLLSIFPTL